MRFIYDIISRANAISFSFLLAFSAIFARRECNFSLFPQDSFNPSIIFGQFATLLRYFSQWLQSTKEESASHWRKVSKSTSWYCHFSFAKHRNKVDDKSDYESFTVYSWRSSISICIDRAITGLLLRYFARYASARRVLSRRDNGEKSCVKLCQVSLRVKKRNLWL